MDYQKVKEAFEDSKDLDKTQLALKDTTALPDSELLFNELKIDQIKEEINGSEPRESKSENN